MAVFKRALLAVFGIRLAVCGEHREELPVAACHGVQQLVLIVEYVIL